jgi:Protein of unknown function DUF84
MSKDDKESADNSSSSINNNGDAASVNNNNNNHKDGNGNRKVLRIAVGTTNPCKIDAVKKAVEKAIDLSVPVPTASNNVARPVELHLEGFPVESGVPDQPFGDVRNQKR